MAIGPAPTPEHLYPVVSRRTGRVKLIELASSSKVNHAINKGVATIREVRTSAKIWIGLMIGQSAFIYPLKGGISAASLRMEGITTRNIPLHIQLGSLGCSIGKTETEKTEGTTVYSATVLVTGKVGVAPDEKINFRVHSSGRSAGAEFFYLESSVVEKASFAGYSEAFFSSTRQENSDNIEIKEFRFPVIVKDFSSDDESVFRSAKLRPIFINNQKACSIEYDHKQSKLFVSQPLSLFSEKFAYSKEALLPPSLDGFTESILELLEVASPSDIVDSDKKIRAAIEKFFADHKQYDPYASKAVRDIVSNRIVQSVDAFYRRLDLDSWSPLYGTVNDEIDPKKNPKTIRKYKHLLATIFAQDLIFATAWGPRSHFGNNFYYWISDELESIRRRSAVFVLGKPADDKSDEVDELMGYYLDRVADFIGAGFSLPSFDLQGGTYLSLVDVLIELRLKANKCRDTKECLK